MYVFETVVGLRAYRNRLRESGDRLGFVPTMGALHEGHLSLVDYARNENDKIIVSIFVNPNQFNDPNDLKNYPRDIDHDLNLLKERGVDAVFAPSVDEVYPTPDNREFDFGPLDKVMEGKHRPGHFNGVAQVITRLFDYVEPDSAYFGQKDFQQLVVIRRLVEMLKYPIEIRACPIVREPDGLAMSSRNRHLSKEEREHSKLIHQVLNEAREKKKSLSLNATVNWMKEHLNEDPFMEVEYVEIIGTEDLQPVREWTDPRKKIACVAVITGKVRLIDNLILD